MSVDVFLTTCTPACDLALE